MTPERSVPGLAAIAAPDRRPVILREDGRRVGWSEWGDERGSPVIFCTGAGMSSLLGFGADAVRTLGLRLLCIDRAGLGLSSPDPEKTFDRWADDVAAVFRAEGIERAPVVGFSQGAPFALALAGAGLASRIAIVAGQDEVAFPATRRFLVPEVAGMVDAIARDRAGFEAAFAKQVDAEGMWRLVLGMSGPKDRALYESPGFAAVYRRSLEEGFAHGPEGYVRDLTLAMSRWPVPPEQIAVPVDLWYGALDTSPVHSPDLGATLAARFQNARRHVLADEGSSLLWTRGAAILEALARASQS